MKYSVLSFLVESFFLFSLGSECATHVKFDVVFIAFIQYLYKLPSLSMAWFLAIPSFYVIHFPRGSKVLVLFSFSGTRWDAQKETISFLCVLFIYL